jgi:hypothetical protein
MKKNLSFISIVSVFVLSTSFAQDPSEKFKQQGGDITDAIKQTGKIYRCVDGYVLALHQNKISFAENWSLRADKRDKIPEKFDQLNPESLVITDACYEDAKPLYWWSNDDKLVGNQHTATTSCDEKIVFLESDPNNKGRPTLFHQGNRKGDLVSRTTCFPVKRCDPANAPMVSYTKGGSSLCHKR